MTQARPKRSIVSNDFNFYLRYYSGACHASPSVRPPVAYVADLRQQCFCIFLFRGMKEFCCPFPSCFDSLLSVCVPTITSFFLHAFALTSMPFTDLSGCPVVGFEHIYGTITTCTVLVEPAIACTFRGALADLVNFLHDNT